MSTHAPPNPIRVGMIALTDLNDPNPISGMPFRMAASLRAQGIEVVAVPAVRNPSDERGFGDRFQDRLTRIHHRRTPMWAKRTMDNLLPARTRGQVLRRARTLSHGVQASLRGLLDAGERIDALFGCCISTAIYDLETDLPIVYFSDATSPVIQATYPVLASRGESYRSALREVEARSLHRTSVAVFAAPSTRRSAIEDFQMPADRTRVVAMGAHVYPDDPSTVVAPAEAPTRASCELLIVAADPVRKRVDLAAQAAEILRGRGIEATLHVVGPGTAYSRASQAVDSVGALRLSDPGDRATHQGLLRRCHLQLLPSLGEAFGIAPCESAHFARPSLVADAGGLPFVVRDGETGLVMVVDAPASSWADAIESLVDDPERYRAMSSRSLLRAREELNWGAWGASMRSIIAEQLG